MISSTNDLNPGDLYTTDGKDVWIVQSFCEHPTVTMQNLRSDERVGGAVGSRNLKDFVKLVPIEQTKGQVEKMIDALESELDNQEG